MEGDSSAADDALSQNGEGKSVETGRSSSHGRDKNHEPTVFDMVSSMMFAG